MENQIKLTPAEEGEIAVRKESIIRNKIDSADKLREKYGILAADCILRAVEEYDSIKNNLMALEAGMLTPEEISEEDVRKIYENFGEAYNEIQDFNMHWHNMNRFRKKTIELEESLNKI